MRASTVCATVALVAALPSCTHPEDVPFDAAALYAGRERVTIAYGANLWAELTECG